MNEHQREKPETKLTIGMGVLLEDESFVKRIGAVEPEWQRFLAQVQLDSTTEENVQMIGPTCLALRKVQELLILFKAKASLIAAKEKKASDKRSKDT